MVVDLRDAISADLDSTGQDLYSSSARKKPTGTTDFKSLLRRVGAAGDLTSRARKSLATLGRPLPFLQLAFDRRKSSARNPNPRVKAMARAVRLPRRARPHGCVRRHPDAVLSLQELVVNHPSIRPKTCHM